MASDKAQDPFGPSDHTNQRDENPSPSAGDETSDLDPALDPSDSFGTSSIMEALTSFSRTSLPKSIGPWHVLRLLGQGGFGVVYLAERKNPDQKAAVKLIKPGMDSNAVLARFEAERQAMAMMTHPNISRLYDSGVFEGRPYFAMEFVPGQSITDYCDRNKMTLKDRLALFQQVCHAVQHAHQKAVIHRDISARNVMVMEVDGKPQAKVIDFGIAKAMGAKLTDRTIDSLPGQIIGNYAYMSPEQADPTSDVDTRTDVYSLGVLLYELLAGERPFDSETIKKAGDEGIKRLIREVDPPKPSTRLSTMATADEIADKRRQRLTALMGALRGELEWIPLMAIRKDRDRRYESPLSLSEDISNYLEGRPLKAGPESKLYRARKFISRYRKSISASLAFLGVIIISLIVVTVALGEARSQRAEALRQAENAREMTTLIEKALESVDPNQPGGSQSKSVAEALEKAISELDNGRLRAQPETEAELRLTIAKIDMNNGQGQVARDQASKAASIYKGLYHGNHPAIAKSMIAIADCERALGSFADAEKSFHLAADMFRRLCGEENAYFATALNGEANCLRSQGKGDQAQPMFEKALAIRKALPATDKRDVVTSLHDLGSCLVSRGKAAEAQSYLDDSLAIYNSLYEGDHPDKATAINDLANCMKQQGKLQEALKGFQTAMSMYQRLFPALEQSRSLLKGDHPDLAKAIVNVAECQRSLGSKVDALKSAESAMQMYNRLFPKGSAAAVDSLCCFFNCMLEQQPFNAALLKELESVLDAYRIGHRCEDNVQLAYLFKSLGSYCENLDDNYDQHALANYSEALARLKRLFQSTNREDILSCQVGIASALLRLDRSKEAIPVLEELIASLESSDKRIPNYADVLAKELDKCARPEEARKVRNKYGLAVSPDQDKHP